MLSGSKAGAAAAAATTTATTTITIPRSSEPETCQKKGKF